MGKHSEWRKLAKKSRRKLIRQTKAKLRDDLEEKEQLQRESLPSYQKWLDEQKKTEDFQKEEEARLAIESETRWLQVEVEAQQQWRELQIKLQSARDERAKQNAKIKLEWEKEQRRLKEIQDKNERELEQRQKLEETRCEEINNFVKNGGSTPEHLKQKLETNPNKQLCPFFQKTSACRFFDVCSRNHVRPGVSHTILIQNFYNHYSLENTENEHGSDSNLEFENHETYDHFREFFLDVVPEMEKCGRIKQFKVCCNHEAHLRGNVYVEYDTTRAALKAFQVFNGRWYGGKQISVEFCSIDSWKSAICGLFFVNRCPKGNACNFLHVFRNPSNLYCSLDDDSHRSSRNKPKNSYRTPCSDRRNWRWSESPEPPVNNSSEWEVEGSHRKSSTSGRRKRISSKSRERSQRKHKSSRRSARSSRDQSKSPSKSKRRRSRSNSRSSARS